MREKIRFLNFSINKILSDDLSILDNARIRLLYYGLALSFFTLAVLLADVLYQHHLVLSITTALLLFTSVVLFKFLTYKPRWIVISHLILIVGSLVNIINIYISVQNVDIVTIEVIIMVMMFSFYMLGRRLGVLYSLLNVTPVLNLLLLQYNNSYIIDLKPEKADASTSVISMFACFGLIAFIHIHFYKAFIKTIRQLNETSDKQRGLTTEFEEAMKKAQKSSEAKSEFLSTMSHEVRTPLNAVIGMSNLLMMGNPRPEQKENLEILKFSAGNLLAIVNDVLDFNKIESGRVVFENVRFNLVELMQNTCGGQMMIAREKGLLFKLDADSRLKDKVLLGDPVRTGQIIYNLVNNAIKFTHEGNVWVKATCIEDRHNSVTVDFTIKDTGIGIEQHRADVIFEPFTQESISTTREYGGTGLGLAIVKRLLELQGLKIKVSSKLNVGSEFSFSMEFPVSTEKIEAVSKPAMQPIINENSESLSSVRMLIAEDNPVNVMLMKKVLSKWDIIPSVAENGARAVELMQYGNFDIILMDLQMPVMNGFDAAIEIRKMHDPKKANIPIIALTASALLDIREQVQRSGINDYVSKPFIPKELFEKIKTLTAAA
jgi:signal transduction histidine kinase/CheY-like chemotaxis protein